MFHVAGWGQNVDPAGVLTPIRGMKDPLFFTDEASFKVPETLSYLIGVGCHMNTATGTRAVLEIPSYQHIGLYEVEPFSGQNGWEHPDQVQFFPTMPLPLEPSELIRFLVASTPGASVLHSGVAWLADGEQIPVRDQIFSVKATGNAVQVQREWREGDIVFDQPLPAGAYVVVGLRVRAASGTVGRLIFNNQRARPGVPRVLNVDTADTLRFRYGNAGVFGVFNQETPPKLEMLNGVATVQHLIFDLVRY